MSRNIGIGNVYTYDYKLENPKSRNVGFGYYDKDKVYTVQNDNGKVNVDDVISNITNDKRLQEEYLISKLPIAASTLRFSFGDLSYDPTTDTTTSTKHNTSRAGGGTPAGYGGTWNKINSEYNNIWEYTYSGHTLQNEFDNGNLNQLDVEPTTVVRFWNDVEHNPIKIIASNTSDCTNFQRFMQGVWALTEIWELDTSNATNVQIMFSFCKNLNRLPKVLDFSKCTANTSVQAVFQDCYKLEEVNEIILNTTSSNLSLNLQNFFMSCVDLKRINKPLNLVNVTNFKLAFAGCHNLEELILLNTSRITSFESSFSCCAKLPVEFFEGLDTSANKTFYQTLSWFLGRSGSGITYFTMRETMYNITKIPFTMTNIVTTIQGLYTGCDLKNIDYTKFENINSSLNVSSLFSQNRNVENGMLETYDLFVSKNITHYNTTTFGECGINTEQGRADRALIPQSWGGDAE